MHWSDMKLTLGYGVQVRCEPGWRLDSTWSQRLTDCDIWFVWAGRGRMQLRDRAIDLHPGVCLWMRPGGLYVAEQDADDRLGVCAQHFDLRHPQTNRPPRPRDLPPEVILVSDIQAVRSLMGRIAFLRSQFRRQHRRDVEQAAIALMRGLLLDLQCAARSPDQRLTPTDHLHQRIVMKLVADLAAAPNDVPSVAAVAAKAGYSPAHFSRIFRTVTGFSPQRYLIERRIERARQLLAETDWSISRIAEALGYADVFFFSRQFKQVTGRPPTQLRGS